MSNVIACDAVVDNDSRASPWVTLQTPVPRAVGGGMDGLRHAEYHSM